MAEQINLWPWRQVQMQQHRRRWLVLVVISAVVALSIILIGRWGLGVYLREPAVFPLSQSQQQGVHYRARLQVLQSVLQQVDSLQSREQQVHSWLTWLPQHMPMQMQLRQWQFDQHNMDMTVATPASADVQILADQVAARQDVSRYAIDAIPVDNTQQNDLLQALHIAITAPTR